MVIETAALEGLAVSPTNEMWGVLLTRTLNEQATSRLVNAFAVEFVVRYMHEAANLFDADYECALIFLAILESNGRQNIRQPWFAEEFGDVRRSIPVEMVRPISRQAIAESLSIPRETVRRKVAYLIERGFLAEIPGGIMTARGVIGNDKFFAAQKRIMGYVRQFLSDLAEYAGTPH
jgi:hypothetical protein